MSGETIEFDEAMKDLPLEVDEETTGLEDGYLLMLSKLIEGVDKKLVKIRKKLEKEIENPVHLAKSLEFQRGVMLVQAVVKGTMAYLIQSKIGVDLCLSICGTDLEHITPSGKPSLIGNFAFMYPESEEELEYHMNVLWTFLDAKSAGWEPGIYSTKNLGEMIEQVEKKAKEYEEFVVRGKL